jgi:hypothetical protein
MFHYTLFARVRNIIPDNSNRQENRHTDSDRLSVAMQPGLGVFGVGDATAKSITIDPWAHARELIRADDPYTPR